MSAVHDMTPAETLRRLGASVPDDCDLGLHWRECSAVMPAGIPDFLQDVHWEASMRAAGFIDRAHEAETGRMAAEIRADAALLRLAWQAWWRVYIDPVRRPLHGWPELEERLGVRAGLFYFLTGLAGVPLVAAHHRRLGIPAEVTRESVQQIRVESVPFYAGSHGGRFGVDYPQLEWLSHYTRERYFRLGRLEFWLEPNQVCRVRVFRHRATRAVLALAPDGAQFAFDGSMYADPLDSRPGTGWSARYSEDAAAFSGNVITPDGHGTRWRVRLPRSEWDLALRPGDLCLTTHIPNGGGLTPQACSNSIARALKFFPKYFPGSRPAGLVSASWLFNNQLRQVFPRGGHLARFLDQFYTVPKPSGPWDGLWFMFLRKGAPDFKEWPQKSTPQRRILAFLQEGHRWRESSMFMLWEEMPRFGTSPYLTNWPYPSLGGLRTDI